MFFLIDSGSLHKGKHFVVAFPKTEDPSYTIKLTLFSDLNTEVQVEWPTGTIESISLTANIASVHPIAGNMRVTDQLESKGFYISATNDITIMVADFYKGGDVFKVFPIEQETSAGLYSYIVASHVPEVSSDYLDSFTLVTTNFSNTFVIIYRRVSGALQLYDNFTLQRLQTMKRGFDNYDPTGTVITSNRSITVISGMCTFLRNQ